MLEQKKSMKIVLLGYMGSGKSSVGENLATVLKADFLDLDFLIESAENDTINNIFSKKGEIYFRKKENTILKTTLKGRDNFVLATGGGTPCYGNIIDFLKNEDNILTIYLKCSLETLTKRLFEEKTKRPLISHLTEKEQLNDFIRKHLFERSFYYTQADITINCDDATIDEIVQKIILKLF